MAKRKLNYWPAWTFFNKILNEPDWEELRVLDFGGSWGNMIRDKCSTISHENYWCVDICKECLDTGKKDFPKSNWIYYNRWNIQYNPKGIPNETFPITDLTFDVIVSYSVFTHTSQKEMYDTIQYDLMPLLKENGMCIFTFYLIEDLPYCLNKYSTKRHTDLKDILDNAKDFENGFYLFDNNQLIDIEKEIPPRTQKNSLSSFYKLEKLLHLFSEYSYEIIPGTEKRQHALILKKDKLFI